MGNCVCANERRFLHNNKNREYLDWMNYTNNFDKNTFKKSIILSEFNSCQEIAFISWDSVQIPILERKSTDPWILNKELLLLYSSKLNKVLPLNLFPSILKALILFDSKEALKQYSEGLTKVSPLIDFKDLAPSMEPLFGRANINNAFLTLEGVEASKRILYLIREKYDIIECCLILPRATQILLWFLDENEVFAILCTLIDDSALYQENPYFVFVFAFSLITHKQMVREIIKLLKYECELDIDEGKMKPVIRDMLYNMLVGYVRPDYFPSVLAILINQGCAGLIKLATKLIHILYHKVQSDIENGARQDLVSLWRYHCKHKGNFMHIAREASKIDLRREGTLAMQSTQSFNESSVDYRPQILGNSSIFSEDKDIENFCILMPSHYLVHRIYLRYTLASEGLDSYNTLLDTWKNIAGPSLLLIATKRQHVRYMTGVWTVSR